MKGKLVSNDLIIGDDGQRYSFEASENKNAARIGDEVDFIAQNSTAEQIYSLSPSTKKSPFASKVHSVLEVLEVRKYAIISHCCSIAALVPFIGLFAIIGALACDIITYLKFSRISGAKDMLTMAFVSCALSFIGNMCAAVSLIVMMMGNYEYSIGIAISAVVSWCFANFGLARMDKVLARSTEEPLFMKAYKCRINGLLLVPICLVLSFIFIGIDIIAFGVLISIILFIAAFGFKFFAWFFIKQIKPL